MSERIHRPDGEVLMITCRTDDFFERFSEQLWNDKVPFKRGLPRNVWLSRLDLEQLPEASLQMYQSGLQSGDILGEAAPADQENRRRRLKSREETRAVFRRQIAEADQRMREKGIIS